MEEVNEKDEYGETALYKACRRKNNQAVSLLLSKPGIFFFFFFFFFSLYISTFTNWIMLINRHYE